MSGFKMPTAYEDIPCEWTAGIFQQEEADGAAVLKAIDQLRRDLTGYHGQLKAHNDLQRHCDNQRKRIAELEGLYAKAKAEKDEASTAYLREYDRAKYLTRQNAKLRELEDENTRLRSCLSEDEENARLIIGEYNELRAKYEEVCETSAMLRADMAAARERQAKLRAANKAQADRLAAENAKLRELVRKLHDELVSCEENEYVPGGHKFDGDMRELGVEVDG